jgi:hypothetical protein
VSYRLDLDEYEEKDLVDEIARRRRLRMQGLCDYCERPSDSPPCKFPERHRKGEPSLW